MLRIFNFVFSLCNQFSASTFDLLFAFLVPPQSENASYAPVTDLRQKYANKFTRHNLCSAL